MSGFRVTLNHAGMRELLRSRGVESEMLRRAEHVAARARSIAPVVSGDYKASIRAETVKHPSRVVGRATAHIEYAYQVEAAHRVLGRAIDAARS